MKNLETNQLIASALKGNLTEPERREFEHRLREDASFRQAWHAERSLEDALDALPNVPVSSNFTRRVVDAALQEQRSSPRRSSPWFRIPIPRFAVGLAAALLLIGTLLVQQNQKAKVREVAETVSDFNRVASALGTDEAPDLLANFEAIQRLNLPAESELDMELLAALQ